MINRELSLQGPRGSQAETEWKPPPTFAYGSQIAPNPPRSPGAQSAIVDNSAILSRPPAFPYNQASTAQYQVNRTFTSNMKQRPRMISPRNQQFMRQNLWGANHRIYDKNGRPITPRELIRVTSHISLRKASNGGNTTLPFSRDPSHTSLAGSNISFEFYQGNRMKRLQDENLSSNVPDLRFKTQQNFMKREMSISNFANRRKSSVKQTNTLGMKGSELRDRKTRYQDFPTNIPDSSSESGRSHGSDNEGQKEGEIGEFRDKRFSVFVDDDQEIEEIIEVESTISQSQHDGIFISEEEEYMQEEQNSSKQ